MRKLYYAFLIQCTSFIHSLFEAPVGGMKSKVLLFYLNYLQVLSPKGLILFLTQNIMLILKIYILNATEPELSKKIAFSEFFCVFFYTKMVKWLF